MTPTAHRSTSPPMRMNLTSMIDVIFLILIYFVVTASFAVGEGVITAKMPQAIEGQAAGLPPQIPLRIKVIAVGRTGYRIELPGFGGVGEIFPGSLPGAQGETKGKLPGGLPGGDFSELALFLKRMQYSSVNPEGLYRADAPVVIEPEGRVRWQHVVNAFHAAVTAQYKNVRFGQAGEPRSDP